MKNFILILLLTLISVIVVSGWKIIPCEGVSMEPTFADGHYVIGISPKLVPFKVGDTVVAVDPTTYWDGHIGTIHKRVKWIDGDEVFLQGDNTKESYDSRHHGTVNATNILKTVIFPKK
jgi:type IV secretory pathway protease TraF